MKLYYANASPYARKVRILIAEKELIEHVEQQLCNPFDDSPELIKANPLGKIPVLITDNGTAFYDSRVICEYLDNLSENTNLIPTSGELHWLVRRWEALADGIMDASYNIVMERKRSPDEQSPQAMERWQTGIMRAIDQANHDVNRLPSSISLAQISLGAALGYLDFRLPDIDWKSNGEKLAAWYNEFSERASMKNTRPK